MEPLNDNEELNRDAPFLASLPKVDPFVVPDGFFDRFPHQVQAAITAQQTTPAAAWPWWKRVSIALPIIALVSLGTWMLSRPYAQVELSAATVTPLSDVELDAMDDQELLAAFDEEEEQDIAPDDLGEVVIDLNDDELLAYLENEDTDINDLITYLE